MGISRGRSRRQHRGTLKLFGATAAHAHQVMVIAMAGARQLKPPSSFGELQLLQHPHRAEQAQGAIHGGQRHPRLGSQQPLMHLLGAEMAALPQPLKQGQDALPLGCQPLTAAMQAGPQHLALLLLLTAAAHRVTGVSAITGIHAIAGVMAITGVKAITGVTAIGGIVTRDRATGDRATGGRSTRDPVEDAIVEGAINGGISGTMLTRGLKDTGLARSGLRDRRLGDRRLRDSALGNRGLRDCVACALNAEGIRARLGRAEAVASYRVTSGIRRASGWARAGISAASALEGVTIPTAGGQRPGRGDHLAFRAGVRTLKPMATRWWWASSADRDPPAPRPAHRPG